MQDLLIPNVVPMPFANQGDKNQIPTNATGSQLASYQEGFPVITQTAIEEGGIPPERNDFNGILYLLSQWQYAFQNGWLPTFNNDVSNAIGGYALNAILWYYPTSGTDANRAVPLRSLVANNVYNFNENADYIGVYWGRVDGFITPEQLAQAIADITLPAGSLQSGPVTTMPGYLLCNGQAVSRTEYARLFAAIGTNFGAGDGSTTFNVPDYRGCFLRGLGGDSAADMYTKQPMGAPNITGAFTNGQDGTSGAFYNTNARGRDGGYEDWQTGWTTNLDASRVNSVYGAANEIRPVNFAVNYFIKY